MDPRRLLPILLCVTLSAVLGTAALVTLRPGPPGPLSRPVAAAPDDGPRSVLADWDARRARAWAAGDVSALRDLYVDGSRSGRADVRMLASYVDRGLTVEGMRTQVLALEVLDESPVSVEVRVTDRIGGAQAVDGETVIPLPDDRPSTRSVVLRLVEGEWLVDEVRE
ncbi:hypothetical protein ASG88_14250 [Nocardioides sp. Soil777]|uniref:hypothetical protein n=1 Tax=Nocardioides sp. Soil777 TaxID=1736409 RepID=UPI0007023F92|nr:hypothetical protein [Nocardioides sp. Soil777]KRE99755.1 hypothetical protein ASG88_14250 [Nocardioides sp. Soil777]